MPAASCSRGSGGGGGRCRLSAAARSETRRGKTTLRLCDPGRSRRCCSSGEAAGKDIPLGKCGVPGSSPRPIEPCTSLFRVPSNSGVCGHLSGAGFDPGGPCLARCWVSLPILWETEAFRMRASTAHRGFALEGLSKQPRWRAGGRRFAAAGEAGDCDRGERELGRRSREIPSLDSRRGVNAPRRAARPHPAQGLISGCLRSHRGAEPARGGPGATPAACPRPRTVSLPPTGPAVGVGGLWHPATSHPQRALAAPARGWVSQPGNFAPAPRCERRPAALAAARNALSGRAAASR